MQTSPPAIGCTSSAVPLCKSWGIVETLLRNFLNGLVSTIGGHSILRASLFSPSISTWRKTSILETLTEIFFEILTACLNSNEKKPRGELHHRACNRKVSLGHCPNSLPTHYYCQTGISRTFASFYTLSSFAKRATRVFTSCSVNVIPRPIFT